MESGNDHLSVLSVITESLENLYVEIPCDRAVNVSSLSLGNRSPEMPLRKYFWEPVLCSHCSVHGGRECA